METVRKFSPEDKLQIVLQGMANENGISELCQRHGIGPTQYYAWHKRLMSSAGEVFNSKPTKKRAAKVEALNEQLKRKDSVIVEIAEENLDPKRGR